MKAQNNKFQESLDFVARHWKPGSFNVRESWRELGIATRPWWRTRTAAAVAAFAILSASAGVFVYQTVVRDEAQEVEEVVCTVDTQAPLKRIERIEFTDATLGEVVNKIETVYGVKVENLPETSANLTLSYEGNAPDLVGTINELLGTRLTVKPCDE